MMDPNLFRLAITEFSGLAVITAENGREAGAALTEWSGDYSGMRDDAGNDAAS